MEAGGTTPRMGEVEPRREQRSRVESGTETDACMEAGGRVESGTETEHQQ